MSCHINNLEDNGAIVICLNPEMGFIEPGEWERRDKKLFDRKYKIKKPNPKTGGEKK